jgi:phage recombination protein Bet
VEGQTTVVAPMPQREWTREELDLIKATCVPQGATDAEFRLLLWQARRTGLDPLARQVYLLRLAGGRCSIVTAIDGFRVVAARTAQYAGQDGPYWCGPDGQWRDVWLESSPPAAARVGILRRDFAAPVYGVATYASYARLDQSGRPAGNWRTMPDVMLAKCAEALGLRKAFPQDLSGLYAVEEMEQAQAAPLPDAAPGAPERVDKSAARAHLRAALSLATARVAGVTRQQLAALFEARHGHPTQDATAEEARSFAQWVESADEAELVTVLAVAADGAPEDAEDAGEGRDRR